MSNRRKPTRAVPLHPQERHQGPVAGEPAGDWTDLPPARFSSQVLTWIGTRMHEAGRLNAWRCEVCQTPFIAYDKHPGTTPFTVAHQTFDSDSDCEGACISGMYAGAAVHAAGRQLAYHGHSQLEPSHEWYRPSRDELQQLVRAWQGRRRLPRPPGRPPGQAGRSMTAGKHDHSGIWPTLPGRELDDADRSILANVAEGDPFRLAWEYKLSHALTDGEGAAFWNGANLVHRAMRDDPKVLTELERLLRISQTPADEISEDDRTWYEAHPLLAAVNRPISALRLIVEWMRDRT